jgi:hypothetical protein
MFALLLCPVVLRGKASVRESREMLGIMDTLRYNGL